MILRCFCFYYWSRNLVLPHSGSGSGGSNSYGGFEGRVKLEKASWMAFTRAHDNTKQNWPVMAISLVGSESG